MQYYNENITRVRTMDKTELIKLLNEIEETAKHEAKWGKNPKYYKGVLDCVKTIKTAMGVEK
jgi:hypothetical protein